MYRFTLLVDMFMTLSVVAIAGLFFNGKSIYGRIPVARSCPVVGPLAAQFCNINVSDSLCVAGKGNVFFGNIARVDKIWGNNDTATLNGAPFLTIGAALAVTAPGDVVWIGPGTYNETITIPAGVIVTGISHAAVIIQAMDVTQATDLVTLGEGAVLQQATLLMSSDLDVQMRGVVHSGTLPYGGSTLYNVNIFIDSNFPGAGTSNVYAVHFTGDADNSAPDAIFGGLINVNVAGTGQRVRWIYIDSAALVEVTSAIGMVLGGTNSIALEVNNAGANLAVGAGAAGGTTADISRTAGLLQITAIYLVNSTANNLGFTNLLFPQTFTWAEPDTPIGPPGIFYLRPGTGEATSFPTLLHLFQKGLAYAMSVHALVPPGIGEFTTFTLQVNGENTPLAITLTDNNTDAILLTTSTTFQANQNFSLEVLNSADAATGDAVVTVGVY